jgi:hypothetical protein
MMQRMTPIRLLVTIGRVARTLVGLAVASTIFLVSGEILARVFGLVDRLNGCTRQLFEVGPSASAELAYRLRPGVELVVGGRAHPGERARPPRAGGRATPALGTIRVLVLGDSVVFGQGVAEEETSRRP